MNRISLVETRKRANDCVVVVVVVVVVVAVVVVVTVVVVVAVVITVVIIVPSVPTGAVDMVTAVIEEVSLVKTIVFAKVLELPVLSVESKEVIEAVDMVVMGAIDVPSVLSILVLLLEDPMLVEGIVESSEVIEMAEVVCTLDCIIGVLVIESMVVSRVLSVKMLSLVVIVDTDDNVSGSVCCAVLILLAVEVSSRIHETQDSNGQRICLINKHAYQKMLHL